MYRQWEHNGHDLFLFHAFMCVNKDFFCSSISLSSPSRVLNIFVLYPQNLKFHSRFRVYSFQNERRYDALFPLLFLIRFASACLLPIDEWSDRNLHTQKLTNKKRRRILLDSFLCSHQHHFMNFFYSFFVFHSSSHVCLSIWSDDGGERKKLRCF